MEIAVVRSCFRRVLHIDLEMVDSKSYVLKACVTSFFHRPGQYVALSAEDIPERFFSIISSTESESDTGCAVVELLINFQDLFSPAHNLILYPGRQRYLHIRSAWSCLLA